MTNPVAPNGEETAIRVVVYRDVGGAYVAQCLDYDIAAQGDDIHVAIEKLELTIESDFDVCATRSKEPKDAIPPAPVYFHQLWEKQSYKLVKTTIPTGGRKFDFAFSEAA
jgi:hypothetical protein